MAARYSDPERLGQFRATGFVPVRISSWKREFLGDMQAKCHGHEPHQNNSGLGRKAVLPKQEKQRRHQTPTREAMTMSMSRNSRDVDGVSLQRLAYSRKTCYRGGIMNSFAQIIEAARAAGPARFVVAQAADSTILEALTQARAAGFARPVLVGRRDEIEKAARDQSLSLHGWDFVESATNAEAAVEAVKLIARGEGDILVKGLMQSADLLRAVLSKTNGLTLGRTLSHVGVFKFMESERFYFVTDAALTIAPDFQQKIDIVQNAVDLAHKLGLPQPIVAVLCAIETVNPDMPATVDAACLAKMAERGAIKGARVEGPLALDNAVSVEAARRKGITSELAGRADILVAPNIEAANILYKALIFFAKAEEAGIVMGARSPIVLASRSDSVRNKLYSLALGALAR